MPPLANLIAFALTSAALIAIPGPSVLFVIARSLSLGRRGGLLSVLGNALGMLPHILLVSLGVGVIVAESVVVFTIIKIVGAGYLVYLGIQAIRHRRVGLDESVPMEPKRSRRLLGEAFLVGATNPKSTVFFVAVMPQFVDLSAGSVPLQLATFGLIFFALALAMDTIWALIAGTARGWFAKSPARISRMRTGGGVIMIGLGGALALSGHKS